MLWKCCTQYGSIFGKPSMGYRTGKGQFSFQFQRKAMLKNVQTITQLPSSHKLAKKCSKFSKPGFNSTWIVNVQIWARYRKGRGTRDQIINIHWIIEKARKFQKNIYFCFINTLTPLTVWITKNCGKFLKRQEYQTTFPASWEVCMQAKEQQLEADIEQWTGSKLEKEYVKAIYFHPAYLTCMKSTSWEMSGWMKHNLESRLPREISITSDMQMTPLLWQKVKRN